MLRFRTSGARPPRLRLSAAARLMLALSLLGATGAAAQGPPAKVIGDRLPNGGYQVVIASDTMTAFPVTVLRDLLKLQNDAATLRAENDRLRQIAELSRAQLAQADSLARVSRTLVATQDSQIVSLKREAQILNALRNRGWLSVELGAGGGNDGAGVLAGVAVRRFRLWGLAQKGNAGGFVGLGFPLF